MDIRPFAMDPQIPPPLPGQSPRIIKLRGWILVLLGPALCAAMAFLIHYLTQTIHHDPSDPTVSHWNGSPEMTARAFGIFWSVFAFGLVGLASGLSLLIRARVGPVLMAAMALSFLAIAWFGYGILVKGHAG